MILFITIQMLFAPQARITSLNCCFMESVDEPNNNYRYSNARLSFKVVNRVVQLEENPN